MSALVDAPVWPASLREDPRFAAVRDLLALFPPDVLPSVEALQSALAPYLAVHQLRLIAAAPAPRRKKAAFDPRSIYELRLAETGEIATRPGNLHDVCNALSWAAFPRAKWALTRRIAELQRAQLSATGALPSARTREHDRLALLDEGGLLRLGDAGVIVGHALWQHAALGHRASRAAVVAFPAPPQPLDSPAALRAAADAAWRSLVTDPAALHAAMAERAGELIDEDQLWRAPAGPPDPRGGSARRG